MLFCKNCRVCDTFFLRRQIYFKYVLHKLFATFTHFSYVAILLSKLLVRLCNFATNVVFVTLFFLRRQIHFKYVLRKLFATFTHFSDVAILLSKLLVHLCYFAKLCVSATFFCTGKFSQVRFAQTFCNVYAFLGRCNFIVEIACAFVQVLRKSFADRKSVV